MATSKIKNPNAHSETIFNDTTNTYQNDIGNTIQLLNPPRRYSLIQIIAYEDSFAGGNRRIININSMNVASMNAQYVVFPRVSDVGILRFEISSAGVLKLISSTVNSLYVNVVYGLVA